MIFLFITLMTVITIVILVKSKEIYFVSVSFKRNKSFLFIQIFQVLVIYLGLIFADYSNKIFSIVLFLVSISEMIKLVYLKTIVNQVINKETNLPYKLTDVISRLSIYSRIIFLIVVNIVVNWFLFK
ncbi:hypothetical protein [uncultured Veillonella sp.]|uniref:hypothetical protein n=1 Tax=uncultured Veillonella sp. TaxID=159268 RepID=UPI0025FD3881|nr:hypothetical protein [uncultured Veillonella sp.]